jgi:UDP-N-acetylmuramate dehydrogenase
LTDDFILKLTQEVRGEVLRDEAMSRHTSLRVGGPADLFVTPSDTEDLRKLLAILGEERISFLVVGGGYNLLVRDRGIRGAVISLERFSRLETTDDGLVHAGAGVGNRLLVDFARRNEFSGLEFLIGIPGRLGGALAMNAGAGGQAITDLLEYIVTVQGGLLMNTGRNDLNFGYRFLRLGQGEIIVEAAFRLKKDEGRIIDERMEAFLAHRRGVQQVGHPNAGSFFKNPPGGPAWRLIDAAGLRGVMIGGAQVSEVHANFLVNRGGATASDFLALADLVKEKVREITGVTLEEEVRIVGD